MADLDEYACRYFLFSASRSRVSPLCQAADDLEIVDKIESQSLGQKMTTRFSIVTIHCTGSIAWSLTMSIVHLLFVVYSGGMQLHLEGQDDEYIRYTKTSWIRRMFCRVSTS